MYANAATIPTTLREGGGRNCRDRLLMDTAVYANLQDTAYTRLTDTGLYAQHGAGDTAAAQANANAIQKEERRVYDLDENVDATFKQ